jgi:hypothetical protein
MDTFINHICIISLFLIKRPFMNLPTLKPSAALRILVLTAAIFRQGQAFGCPCL